MLIVGRIDDSKNEQKSDKKEPKNEVTYKSFRRQKLQRCKILPPVLHGDAMLIVGRIDEAKNEQKSNEKEPKNEVTDK